MTTDTNVELTRKVRTKAGADFYGIPIGGTITTEGGGAEPGTGDTKSAVKEGSSESGKGDTTTIKVGKSSYEVPKGSKAINSNTDGLVYSMSPDHEIRAFTETGEVPIPDDALARLKQSIPEAAAAMPGDPEDEEVDAERGSLADLETGSTLTDPEGAVFTKTDSDSWNLEGLDIEVDSSELEDLYTDGVLTLQKAAPQEPEQEESDIPTMSHKAFKSYVNGLEVGSYFTYESLSGEEQTATKEEDDEWVTNNGKVVNSSALYLVRNKLKLNAAKADAAGNASKEEPADKPKAETKSEPKAPEKKPATDKPAEKKEDSEKKGPKSVSESENVPDTDWLDNAAAGTVVEYDKNGTTIEYTKQQDGFWSSSQSTARLGAAQFQSAVSRGALSVAKKPAPAKKTKVKLSADFEAYRKVVADHGHPATTIVMDQVALSAEPSSETLVALGGSSDPLFSVDEVAEAVTILENYEGKLFKSELTKKGSRLGVLNFNEIVGLHKDKLEGKKKVIALLKSRLSS